MFLGLGSNVFLNAFEGGQFSRVSFLVENLGNCVKMLFEFGLFLRIHGSGAVDKASIIIAIEGLFRGELSLSIFTHSLN